MLTRSLVSLLSVFGGVVWSGAAMAALISFQAVYVIDTKTTFDPTDTVIITDPDWGNTNIGDRFIVDFTVDSAATDSNHTESALPTPGIAQGDQRDGNFGSVLRSLAIRAAPGNTGTFDPSGIAFKSDTGSKTIDGQGIWQIVNPGDAYNNEEIQFVAATDPTPSALGGSLFDIALTFRNTEATFVDHPIDYLDDDSLTTSPFTFDDLFGGTSQVFGDARDLALLSDDYSDFFPNPTALGRPLNMVFGEAFVQPATGSSFQENLYAYGTFESLQLASGQVPAPGTLPLILASLGGFVAMRRRRA